MRKFTIEGGAGAGVPVMEISVVGVSNNILCVQHWWATHQIYYGDKHKLDKAYETLVIAATHATLAGAKSGAYRDIYHAWKTKGAKGVSQLIPE